MSVSLFKKAKEVESDMHKKLVDQVNEYNKALDKLNEELDYLEKQRVFYEDLTEKESDPIKYTNLLKQQIITLNFIADKLKESNELDKVAKDLKEQIIFLKFYDNFKYFGN